MMDPASADGVAEGACHHILTRDLGEGLRSVFAGDDQVVHSTSFELHAPRQGTSRRVVGHCVRRAARRGLASTPAGPTWG